MRLNEGTDYMGQLVEVLGRLEGLHGDLAAVVDRKIECMRECDVAGMNECTASERELVGRIGEAEGRRRLLAERLAKSLGLSARQARRMSAAELAEKLPPAPGEQFLAITDRLRSLTARIARRNHVAGSLGGRMLKHMDAVLSAMTAPKETAGAYSPAGKSVATTPRQLFEAVG